MAHPGGDHFNQNFTRTRPAYLDSFEFQRFPGFPSDCRNCLHVFCSVLN
jgi:hypothetical protein